MQPPNTSHAPHHPPPQAVQSAPSSSGIKSRAFLQQVSTPILPPSCSIYDITMSCAAIEARARQSAALSAVIHAKCTDPDLQRVLSALHPAATAGMTPHALATIREANRMVTIACRLPSSLVRREASLASTGNPSFASSFPHAFVHMICRLRHMGSRSCTQRLRCVRAGSARVD